MAAPALALLAALAFALGSTLQQRGALETPAPEGDPRFLIQILRRPAWLAGASLQAAGWILQAAALDRGSLVVVQSLCTLSIVIALPLGALLTNQRVGRRAATGAVCTVIGIVVFLAVGQPQNTSSRPAAVQILVWGAVAGAAMVALAVLAGRRRGALASALFATGAGIGYGVQGAATKGFVEQLGGGLVTLLVLPATWVLLVSALAGFGLQQSALKTGWLGPAVAASNAATLASSVLLGVVLFDESIGSAPGSLPVAIAALALAVVGVALLALPEGSARRRVSASR